MRFHVFVVYPFSFLVWTIHGMLYVTFKVEKNFIKKNFIFVKLLYRILPVCQGSYTSASFSTALVCHLLTLTENPHKDNAIISSQILSFAVHCCMLFIVWNRWGRKDGLQTCRNISGQLAETLCSRKHGQHSLLTGHSHWQSQHINNMTPQYVLCPSAKVENQL